MYSGNTRKKIFYLSAIKKARPVLIYVIINVKLNCSGLVSDTLLAKERGLAKREVSLPDALKQNISQSTVMAS